MILERVGQEHADALGLCASKARNSPSAQLSGSTESRLPANGSGGENIDRSVPHRILSKLEL